MESMRCVCLPSSWPLNQAHTACAPLATELPCALASCSRLGSAPRPPPPPPHTHTPAAPCRAVPFVNPSSPASGAAAPDCYDSLSDSAPIASRHRVPVPATGELPRAAGRVCRQQPTQWHLLRAAPRVPWRTQLLRVHRQLRRRRAVHCRVKKLKQKVAFLSEERDRATTDRQWRGPGRQHFDCLCCQLKDCFGSHPFFFYQHCFLCSQGFHHHKVPRPHPRSY